MSDNQRERHVVVGRVQGVGFRPFVYRLAREHALAGYVLNAPEGVIIEVQGPHESLERFATDLIETLPPLAMIVEHSRESVAAIPEDVGGEFAIRKSTAGIGHHVLVSPDMATCPDCLADMADPANRRYRYPFTNCTNCGPRYTITRSLPYDRHATSMACFPLCDACRAEYEDPLDRRFHAQPNACPVCGPRLWLTDRHGKTLAEGAKAVANAVKALRSGRILALKGLGGFHLAADASSHEAVAELRRRKKRPAKPLAVMAADLETLSRLAHVSPQEAALLTGRERPIVLVTLKPDARLSPDISPDTGQLGAMLPYTPLHQVLLTALRESLPSDTNVVAALVMTSGNLSSEPISLGNREALSRLGSLADFFLLHDRDILVRTDDSVVRVLPADDNRDRSGAQAAVQFLRRARGYTPSPIFLPSKGPCVLGVGPELKNTVCLTKGGQAFVSQHIGDMQNLETAAFHKEVIDHLERILQVRPEAVVADLHPDYLSTRYALEESGLPVLRLQHHYAHVLAVMAEKGLMEPVLGLALDGSGYGEDRTIWGGEFLYVDPVRMEFKRLAHFAPFRLPGGEAAIRQPWRLAMAALCALGRDPFAGDWPWLKGREQAAELVRTMLDKGLNSPVTSSCGRLFDAVSALVGQCSEISYEGQAAIRLEHILDPGETGGYVCGPLSAAEDGGAQIFDSLSLVAQAADDTLRGIPATVVSSRFHNGLSSGLAQAALALCNRIGTRHVALSGGVFLNKTLSRSLHRNLSLHGLTSHMHEQTPPGDGCISLGQAFFGQITLSSSTS
ncbi:MAG: carbamoyltransferase HypF [Acidobacteriota bacterium]